MKTFLIISTVLFFISPVFAQSGWFSQNPGTGQSLLSVFFTDANYGYVTGFNGTIIKTTNAGNNWYPLTIGTTNVLRSVFFTDINTGYIVSGSPTGNFGDVYKTTNAGSNWNTLILPEHRHFYSIFFINSNTGYVSGYNVILKTTDAGISWVSQALPGGLQWLFSIHFLDVNTGYAAGGTDDYNDKYIIKTTNGGQNWEIVFNNTGNGLFWGISFIDANIGVAVGGPYIAAGSYIYRTTNAGINWTEIFTDSNSSFLWSVRFISPSIGYAVGGTTSSGVILKTTNAGINWHFQTVNVYSFLTSTFFTSIDTGYVVGNGRILKTTSGGEPIGIKPISNEVPLDFMLYQNYPNPFNPSTKIKFENPVETHINTSLQIFDILGREVTALVNEQLKPGTYEVEWDASKYSSGVYYYTLRAGNYKETKKMILLK